MNVLLVEDDENSRKSMKRFLENKGFRIITARNGNEALGFLNDEVQLIISDKKMPEMDGIELLKRIRAMGLKVPVIIVTAFGDIDSAVEAVKLGATHYIQKPIHPDELLLKMNDVIERQELTNEVKLLRKELNQRTCFDDIIGNSLPMAKVFEKIKMVAPTKSTVLIQGESGTGKELVAKAVHNCSQRKDEQFIIINCSAMPEALLESELFGHVKGSFTGATTDKRGLFEEANHGTLFIDEIGELKKEVQVKLLRIIENKTLTRVGSNTAKVIDVRLVTATNRNLEEEVMCGNFRNDLFYRLNVVRVDLPPLRERKEDIPLMISNFTNHLCEENGIKTKIIDQQVIDVLTERSWPGNVRELRNFMESVIVLSNKDKIGIEDLPGNMQKETITKEVLTFDNSMSLSELEKEAITYTMKRFKGNKSKTAVALGVSLRTIQRKMHGYNLEDSSFF